MHFICLRILYTCFYFLYTQLDKHNNMLRKRGIYERKTYNRHDMACMSGTYSTSLFGHVLF